MILLFTSFSKLDIFISEEECLRGLWKTREDKESNQSDGHGNNAVYDKEPSVRGSARMLCLGWNLAYLQPARPWTPFRFV